jgi:hypothetical protein
MNARNAHGPASHFAVGIGDIADRLQELAALPGMEAIGAC